MMHPSEFQMINENSALSEVIPLKVYIMEIKTKPTVYNSIFCVWFLIETTVDETIYRIY